MRCSVGRRVSMVSTDAVVTARAPHGAQECELKGKGSPERERDAGRVRASLRGPRRFAPARIDRSCEVALTHSVLCFVLCASAGGLTTVCGRATGKRTIHGTRSNQLSNPNAKRRGPVLRRPSSPATSDRIGCLVVRVSRRLSALGDGLGTHSPHSERGSPLPLEHDRDTLSCNICMAWLRG